MANDVDKASAQDVRDAGFFYGFLRDHAAVGGVRFPAISTTVKKLKATQGPLLTLRSISPGADCGGLRQVGG